MISARTGVLCVIGNPIEHSMSPKMHNAAITALDLDLVYMAFNVPPGRLEGAIAGIKALGIIGANVTIPHKINVMQYLDEIHPLARNIGAVNTITNVDGVLLGSNTDGLGAMKALKECNVELDGMNIVIAGAGGAARALGFTLAPEVSRISILARRERKSKQLARDIKMANDSTDVEGFSMAPSIITRQVRSCDLFINATPVGMHPNESECILENDWLQPNTCVFDLVYNPLETKLLEMAKAIGCKIVHGLDMLVYQGAVAFESWTGICPPISSMKQAALVALDNRK
ncbi:shikimate dehydrogenase [Candidatus Bathyarchaeota archaeon]|nr:shikimate dehydrogenase [Candidatus Bathyarchaeota archaeon]